MINIFQKLNYERAKRHRRLDAAKNDLFISLVRAKLAMLRGRLNANAHPPKLRSRLKPPTTT